MTIAEMIAAPANAELLTDEEVVERVLAGQSAWFEVLMRRYNQRLYRVSRSIVGDDAEAEDVMQEAYVRAYQHLDQFDGRARFATWLTRIAVHEALARLRHRRRVVEIDAFAESSENPMIPAANTPNPEQEVLIRTLGVILESAINQLPAAYRSVFMLREMEEMSTAETAECLGLSEEAVKVRLHRARARLRKTITAQTQAATVSAFQFNGARCDRIVAAVLARLAPRS
ncbi:MAG: RNA polymerase sigma factor [Blastocatellia bacterium]